MLLSQRDCIFHHYDKPLSLTGIFNLCQVVKVADFGVARVQAQSGIMTAETGTYRRMAPEYPLACGVTWTRTIDLRMTEEFIT